MQMTSQIFMSIGNIVNIIVLQMSMHCDKNVSCTLRLELCLGLYVMIIIC